MTFVEAKEKLGSYCWMGYEESKKNKQILKEATHRLNSAWLDDIRSGAFG
jgi:hypothetical protein